MTTSNKSEPTKILDPENWSELSDSITPRMRNDFSRWLEGELEQLETELNRFVTPRSTRKNLGR